MKEATGDLNMTVIIVLIVAGLVTFFSVVIGPLVIGGIKSETNCSDAICKCSNCSSKTDCKVCTDCKLKGKNDTFSCPYKG